jgi:maleylacetate reductase
MPPVDVLTNSRTPETTPSAVLGPFYVDGLPAADHGADIAAGLPGTRCGSTFRVVGPDGNAVPGATMDVWQSNEDGFYDVQLPEIEGPVLRARFTTDADGRGIDGEWRLLEFSFHIAAPHRLE